MSIGIGDVLREERERQGRSIDEASRETRIRVDYLDAIEDEDFAAIGGDVYAKGFIATYARWLGLDPAPMLERYRREVQGADYDAQSLVEHPVAKPASPSRSSWPLWVGASAIFLLAAFWLIGQFDGRGLEPAAPPGVEVSETAGPPNPTDTRPGGSATPTEADSPTPSPTPTGVTLVLLVEDRSWMRITVRDQVVFEGIAASGETKEFTADEDVALRLGNAGGVRLVLNGEDLGAPGASGQVWNGVCTISGCQEAT